MEEIIKDQCAANPVSKNNKTCYGFMKLQCLTNFLVDQLTGFVTRLNYNSKKVWQGYHTSQDSFYKWTKILSLEIDIIGLETMVKSGLYIFVLKFSKPLQICFCNKKFQITFHCHFNPKMSNSRLYILFHLWNESQLV